MNKKVVVGVIVVLLLLLGGWYYLSPKKTGITPNAQTDKTDQSSNVSSIKDLITTGTAQTCTYTTESGSGSVYVSGKKVRGDFNVTVDNKTSTTHMIMMDNTNYIWTEGQKTGFKMALDISATPASVTGSETTTTPNQEFDPTANNNYKCTTWATDPTQFTLPTDVTFSTFAMPNAMQPPSQDKETQDSSQCSYCNALSGDDKAQCLKALSCN